jgi:hypothetical protein
MTADEFAKISRPPTVPDLWEAIAAALDAFTPAECQLFRRGEDLGPAGSPNCTSRPQSRKGGSSVAVVNSGRFPGVLKKGRGFCASVQDEQMKGTAMLSQQTVIAAALGLGLSMTSGAGFAAPIGVQSLLRDALIGERGATVEAVHYRQRRYAYPGYRHGYVYPQYRYRYVYPGYRYGYVYPRYRYGYGYPQYRYTYPYDHYYRPGISFGLRFGW